MRLRMSSYTLTVEPVQQGESVSHYRVRVFRTDGGAVLFDGSAESITQAEALGDEQLDRIIRGGGLAPAHRAA